MDVEKKLVPLRKVFMLLEMEVFGVWPKRNASMKIFYIKFAAKLLVFVYFIYGVVCNLVDVSRDDRASFAEVIEALFAVQSIATLVYNIITTRISRKLLLDLCECLRDFELFGLPPNLPGTNRKVELLSTVIFTYVLIAGFIIQFCDYLIKDQCLENNNKTGRDVLCGFGAKIIYPYKINYSPLYQIHYFLATACLMTMGSGGVLCGIICYSTAEFISVRLEHLNELLAHAFETERISEVRERFRICVTYHHHVIRLVDKANKSLMLVAYPIYFQYSANIGLSLFNFLLIRDAKGILNAVGWIFCVFIICFYGQKLTTKGEAVADAAYESKWYEADVSAQKNLIMVIKRAQKPLRVKTGPLACLNLPTFVTIINGAFTIILMRSNLLASKAD